MSTHTIRTARLLLRSFTHADIADVFACASNPNVSRYMVWPTHQSVADSAAFIDSVLSRPPERHTWAICVGDEQTVAGAILFGVNNETEAELHYWLAEPFWNRGLMTEAARAVLQWGLNQYPTLHRVMTNAVSENIPSQRVMEKCGCQFARVRVARWAKYAEPVELREFVMHVPCPSN